MEGVCSHQKFGFCKFKETCKNQHLKEICEDLLACPNTKGCHKRHPRECKRYAVERFCRFGDGCAYSHQTQSKVFDTNNHTEIDKKVVELEKKVDKMSDKIVQLETKIKQMELKEGAVHKDKQSDKKVDKLKESTEIKDDSNDPAQKKSKIKEKKVSLFKFGAEARQKVVENINSKENYKSSMKFQCEQCDYMCEKHTILKKHMNSNHTDQKCKVCRKEFKTSMELVRHVAKEHHEEEEEWNVKFQSTPKSPEDKDKISEKDENIPNELKTIKKKMFEEKVEERNELENLEDELRSFKMELGLK